MRVTIADVRAARMCGRGARQFFERHGWDWSDFLRNGIEASTVSETGDAMALQVVEAAHVRRGQ